MAEAPVYDPVSTDENEDKPPSYFNVISQIKHAKSEAKSPTELGLRTLKILAGSCKYIWLLYIKIKKLFLFSHFFNYPCNILSYTDCNVDYRNFIKRKMLNSAKNTAMVDCKWQLWSCISFIKILSKHDNLHKVIKIFEKKKFLNFMFRSRKKNENSEPKILSCFNGLLSLFLFIWFILGKYFISIFF